jgi:hypothetical protein
MTMVNEILKAAKNPLNGIEAQAIEDKIMEQHKAENESQRLLWIAQDLRLEIQKALNFSADEYYRFIRDIL